MRTALLHWLAWTVHSRSQSEESRKHEADALRLLDELHSALDSKGCLEAYRQAEANLQVVRSLPPQLSLMTHAIEQRNLPLVRLLIDMGFSVHLPDEKGNTPLHLAVATGQYMICMCLLQRGARVRRARPIERDRARHRREDGVQRGPLAETLVEESLG